MLAKPPLELSIRQWFLDWDREYLSTERFPVGEAGKLTESEIVGAFSGNQTILLT